MRKRYCCRMCLFQTNSLKEINEHIMKTGHSVDDMSRLKPSVRIIETPAVDNTSLLIGGEPNKF